MNPDQELRDFGGTCRLFPLPEVVLFPHCVLPLHIFEPRYREMTEDALASDRLIAMVKLQDGADWSAEVDPPIEPVACIGKIFDHRKLEDGRFNLLVVGLKRVRLIQELPKERLFRSAEAELLEDEYPEESIDSLRTILVGQFRKLCSREGRVEPEIARLLDKPVALGVLVDLLGHYLGLPSEIRQAFLSEVRVEDRVRSLIGILNVHLGEPIPNLHGEDPEFPPPFSLN